VPAQLVDATPSNQLIRQYFPLENRSVRLYSIRPSQDGIPFESALANDFQLLGPLQVDFELVLRRPIETAKVLLHGHCHQKALMKMNHEEALLRGLGVEVQSLDSGCCGMAGPFGFQKEKFEVSQAVAERVLLPAVRNATQDTLIVADGFSCREQVLQGTGKPAIHLAEVLKMALKRKDSSEAN